MSTYHQAGQDMPPIGPHDPIPYARSLPKRGPPSWILLTGLASIVTFGFYMTYQGMCIKKELKREKLQARFHLLPYLLAEQDRAKWERIRERRLAEAMILGKEVIDMNPYYSNKNVLVEDLYDYSGVL